MDITSYVCVFQSVHGANWMSLGILTGGSSQLERLMRNISFTAELYRYLKNDMLMRSCTAKSDEWK